MQLINFTFALAMVNMTGMRAGRVLLALYALHLGAQPLLIGFLAATFSLLPMLLSLQAGKLSDRFGARWLLTAGALGGAGGMLVPYVSETLPAAFVAAALSGLSLTVYNVSLQNLVGLLSAPETRARNFSTLSLMMSIGSFVGPLSIGFSIDHFGYRASFASLACLLLVPFVMLVAWGRTLPGGSRRPTAKGGIREDKVQTAVWRVLATSALVQIGLDLFQFYIPVYGRSIGLSASAIGMVLAMYSAAAFVVRLLMPYLLRRWSEERVLAYAFYCGAASFLLVPFFHSAVVLSVIAFAFGLGMGCGQPITMMMTFSNSAAGRSGEALGLRLTVNHLTRVVGPVLFGWVGSAFGLPPIFWITALLLGSGGFLSRSNAKTRAAKSAEESSKRV